MYKLRLQYRDSTPKMYTFDFVYGIYKTKKKANYIYSKINIYVLLNKTLGCIFIYNNKTHTPINLFNDIRVTRLSDESTKQVKRSSQYSISKEDFITEKSDLKSIGNELYTEFRDSFRDDFVDGLYYQLSNISYSIEECHDAK